MALAQVGLDDRYALERGRVLMTGIQALVRLPMLQRQRDRAAGLNTAGFISGYRGSPLGGLDQALWRARKFLDRSQIVFQPGINEDLAATAVWGSQQVGLFPGAKYDGVFALWYGKGPGVDRSLDVLKHGNHAGTSKHGGVLVVAGDDHAAKSSTLPHQSDHVFAAAVIPVLNPSGVQDYLDLGIHGWAMSRYSGCWVAFKAVTDTVESTAVVDVDPHRVEIVLPQDFVMPPGGLSIRWPDPPLAQEARMQEHKAYAALAYARANRLNRIVIDSPRPRLRHHDRRQVLSRRPPGAGRSGHRRAARGRDRAAGDEGRHDLAARARGHAPLRRGAGGDPGRRGEAAAPRVPAQGRALQLERGGPAARHRQVRREGRVVAAPGRLAAARRPPS